MVMPDFFASLIKGLVIGFSIAAPVGPIGVMCIQRSVSYGRKAGFISGIGAASADAVYGLLCAVGVASLLLVAKGFFPWFRLAGGLFLLWLALQTLLPVLNRKKNGDAGAAFDTGTGTAVIPGKLSLFGSTFLLTLSNPMTILSFAGIMTALAPTGPTGIISSLSLVVGVFCGSAAWWFVLSGVSSLVTTKIGGRDLFRRWVSILSSVVIAVFGVTVLATAVTSLLELFR